MKALTRIRRRKLFGKDVRTLHEDDDLDARKPSRKRRRELRTRSRENSARGNAPYAGVALNTFGEFLWVLLERGWSGGIVSAQMLESASMSGGADVFDIDLLNTDRIYTIERIKSSAFWFVSKRERLKAGYPDYADIAPNLEGCDLSGIRLNYADLQGANLTGASLAGTDLREANLHGATLINACLDGTLLPRDTMMNDVSFISSTRADELEYIAETHQRAALPAYTGVAIESRNELQHMLARLNEKNALGDGLRGTNWLSVNVSGMNVPDLDLEGALLIDEKTAEMFRAQYAGNEQNEPKKQAPYKGVVIKNRRELLWIMRERRWLSAPDGDKNRRVNLRGALLEGADLSGARLRNALLNDATLTGAHLRTCDFTNADLNHAVLGGADLRDATLLAAILAAANMENAVLRGADLRNANLRRTRLVSADLRGANLEAADSRSTDFRQARLEGASLRGTRTDIDTVLSEARVNALTRLGEINWNAGVSLTTINWSHAKQLGEEDLISQAEWTLRYKRFLAMQRGTEYLQKKDRSAYIRSIRFAIQAYRALAAALRSQGMGEVASRYRLRDEQLQRRLLRIVHPWNPFAWIHEAFSLALDIVAGYGEKPLRTVGIYLATIVAFMLFYVFFGQRSGLHHDPDPYLWWLRFSVLSFHGISFFFPDKGINADNPIQLLSNLETLIGVFIQFIFVAAFARKFLGS